MLMKECFWSNQEMDWKRGIRMKTRLEIIDIFKGLAIIAVVMSHFCEYISDINPFICLITGLGARGVQLFFILSGWTSYLSYQSLENFDSDAAKQKHFYIKRIISILPCWYFMILVWQLTFLFLPDNALFSVSSVKTIIVNVLFLHGIIVTDSNVVGGDGISALKCFYIFFFPMYTKKYFGYITN